MSSGTAIYLPVPEQRALVDALALGPIDNGDGTVTCRACPDRTFDPKRYNVHRWGSHVRYLDRVHALELPGMAPCELCDETMLATSLGKHVRDVHGVRVRDGGEVHAPEPERQRRGRPRKGERASTSVERAPINGRRAHVEMPSPTDAGLAILAGLAPGGSVPVEQLHDVVEWLATTERIVGIARGNTS